MNKIIIYLFSILFFSVFVEGACVSINQSTENNITTGTWTICSTTVYNFTLVSNSKNAIYLNESNTIIDCNNSILHGNGTGAGIQFGYSGTKNITILNCKMDTFNYGLKGASGATAGLWNAYINNTEAYNISGCGNAGFYNGGFGNVTVNNSYFHDNRNISNCAGTNPHGIYVSSAAAGNDNRSSKNFIVENTRLINNSNSGIQYNGQMYMTGIIAKNVTACNNTGSGFNIYTVTGAVFQDLTACYNGLYGMNLWRGDYALPANNSVITRVNFTSNTAHAVTLNNDSNNFILNNTFTGTEENTYTVADYGISNINIFEIVPFRIVYYSSGTAANNAYINLTYASGYDRNVSIRENNITFNYLQSPYNDIKFNSVINTTNLNNGSFILSAADKIEVGDFAYPSVCDPSGLIYYCNITMCNYNASCSYNMW